MDLIGSSNSTSNEIEASKLVRYVTSQINQMPQEKTKSLKIIETVMLLIEIYFSHLPKSGVLKKTLVLEILTPIFTGFDLYDAIEYILHDNKLFKKSMKNKFNNYFSKKKLKKKLRSI